MKTLQSENLKLYEKVRYMQSYREDAMAPSRGATSTLDALNVPANSPGPSTSAGAAVGGPATSEMGKYKARYEESMNPFEVFRGRVS